MNDKNELNWRDSVVVRLLLLVAQWFCSDEKVASEIKAIATSVYLHRS